MLIQKLRDGSTGILAKIIVGLIIVVFALFGFGSITTFLAPTPKVAVVNGEDITQQAMEIAVERNRRLLMARGAQPADIDEDQLRKNVLQSLISREILNQAADNLDLYYSDAALDADIVGSPVFQIDGVFDPDQFKMVLGGAGYSPLKYRDETRTDKLFNQIITGIRQSAFLTKQEAHRYLELSKQRRDLAYLTIRSEDLLDQVVVRDDEIESYYNEHPASFVTEETVNVEYVELNLDDIAKSVIVEEGDVEKYFAEHLGSYTKHERRRVAHILVEFSDVINESEAKVKADEIYDRIKEGEDYSMLAAERSDDLGSKANGGDLGFNEQGTFFPEFEAKAYDLALNQVSEPVKTEIGYHLIKVIDIEEGFSPSIGDVREMVEKAYRDSAAGDEFVKRSARLAELLFESIDLLVPATEMGLEIQSTGHVSRNAVDGLMSESGIATAAFGPDVLIDGNNSDVIEVSDIRHIGFRVLEHVPSATKSLASVTEDVRYILMRLKAADLAKTQATEIISRIESGSLAQFVADEFGLNWVIVNGAVRSQSNVDALILRQAFTLSRPVAGKETVGFLEQVNGDTVVLRISGVINDTDGSPADEEILSLAGALAGQLGLVDFQELEQSLTESADLEYVSR